MAANIVSEVDKNFLSDNFLQSEDWGFMNESKMEDIPYFLKLGGEVSHDELQYTLLDSEIGEDYWKDQSDGSDSGVDTLSMKPEPMSPFSGSDTKREPFSPASLFDDDSLLYAVSANNIELDSCFDGTSDMTQDVWDSIQLMLTNSSSSSVNLSQCQPIVLSSDIAPQNYNQPVVNNASRGAKQAPMMNHANTMLLNNGDISHVVNSKVKIKPKPVATNASSGGSKHMTTAATIVSNLQQSCMLLSSSPPDVSMINVRALKRHERMIKNRESACLSRKRKKDYMQQLEQQLYSCNVDNEQLKSENSSLKRKMEQLQQENEQLKRLIPVSKTTGAGVSVLLCVVFICAFNYLPFQMSQSVDVNSPRLGESVVHRGRSLLSVSNNDITASRQLTATDRFSLLQDVTDLMLSRRREGSSFNSRNTCPTFFNSTESLRLVSELEGWVLGHEEELRRQRELMKVEQSRVKQRKKYYPPRRIRAAMQGNLQANHFPANRYELQVFQASNSQYDHFMEAISRRNDTFYVVSFQRDHLLLPATAHNKTTRPRMSVMMPAVGLNETVGSNIAMMQIDCEVTATRLIHIDKSAIPADMINRTVASHDWLSTGKH